MPHLLIVDAYDDEVRGDEPRMSGFETVADLFGDIARAFRGDVTSDNLLIDRHDVTVPTGEKLAGYDAVIWSGSTAHVYEGGADVEKQSACMRRIFDAGLPVLGICFGLQLAVHVAGGRVEKNTKGLEWGIGRGNRLTGAGGKHPIFAGRASRFDVMTWHHDIVTKLPAGAEILAENDMTAVQALAFRAGKSSVIGLQYHPELALESMAVITEICDQDLVDLGFFDAVSDARAYAVRLRAGLADGGAMGLDIGSDIAARGERCREIGNFLGLVADGRL